MQLVSVAQGLSIRRHAVGCARARRRLGALKMAPTAPNRPAGGIVGNKLWVRGLCTMNLERWSKGRRRWRWRLVGDGGGGEGGGERALFPTTVAVATVAAAVVWWWCRRRRRWRWRRRKKRRIRESMAAAALQAARAAARVVAMRAVADEARQGQRRR